MKDTKLYVGNLAYSVEANDLQTVFEAHGPLTEAKVVKDHDNRSKGFGFVTFENTEDANAALEKLNGTELQGRQLKVSVARDKVAGAGGAGGARGGFGGGQGRGGFGGGQSRGGFGGNGGNRDRGGDRDGGSRGGW